MHSGNRLRELAALCAEPVFSCTRHELRKHVWPRAAFGSLFATRM